MSKPKRSAADATPTPEVRTARDSVFAPQFREDLAYWVETDRKIAQRLLKLVESCLREPFDGPGKPEPLKYLGANVWSRRLTLDDRLVYVVKDDRIDFLMGRYHY